MKHFIKTLSVLFGGAFLLIAGVHFLLVLSQSFREGGLTDTLFPGAFAGFGSNTEDLFANYTSWPNSTTLDTTDTVVQTLFNLYGSGNGSSLADMNGDGLTDVMVHQVSTTRKYAVLLNNGNMGFDLAYKCVKTSSTWYGDCAQ